MTDAALQLVPVFPLPGIVLFPRVVLPLHIFEPRYRLMLAEALDGHGRIAMALAVPRGAPDDESEWEVEPVVGIGKVVSYEKLEDGTSNVLLLGDSRARVEEWIGGRPFRTARLSVLKDIKPRSTVRKDRLRAQLREDLSALLEGRGPEEEAKKLLQVFSRDPDVGFLADFLAYHFLTRPSEKQQVLEELEVERRVGQVRGMLGLDRDGG